MNAYLQHMIETLMLASWQLVYAHACHPMVFSSAFHVPASDDSLVVISFVMEDLSNFVLDVT